jgi:hypothetical protein
MERAAVKRWVWLAISFVVIAIGVVTISVGLDKADKLAGVIGAVVAVIGLGLGLAGPEKPMAVHVRRSGRIDARGPGYANTGVDAVGKNARYGIEVEDSGNIDSSGDGGTNTGVTLR